MTPDAIPAGTEAAAQRPPVPGLVEQVTSYTAISGPSKNAILRDLNSERRIRRLRNVVRTAAESCRAVRGHRTYAAMVTLTYRDEVEWAPKHMSTFLACVKEHLSRRRHRRAYQWVMELTQRGRVHYHLLVWLPEGVKLPKPDQAGWWTHGMSRIERARNAVGYLVKYASKCDSSGEFPKGARLFGVGVSGAMQETRQERTGNHRAGLPRWLRESTTGRCSRRVGGVWIERESGREFASPFQVRCSRDAWGVWTVFIEPRGES